MQVKELVVLCMNHHTLPRKNRPKIRKDVNDPLVKMNERTAFSKQSVSYSKV